MFFSHKPVSINATAMEPSFLSSGPQHSKLGHWRFWQRTIRKCISDCSVQMIGIYKLILPGGSVPAIRVRRWPWWAGTTGPSIQTNRVYLVKILRPSTLCLLRTSMNCQERARANVAG